MGVRVPRRADGAVGQTVRGPDVADLLGWLEAFGLFSGVARSAPVYAATSAGHIAGIALLAGPVLLVDLRLAGWLSALDGPALRVLRAAAALGAAATLATGALLYAARPFEYAGNAAMQAKLLVVALALANALAFEWAARRDAPASRPGHPYARAAGLASLLLWPLALVLGRWVAFV